MDAIDLVRLVTPRRTDVPDRFTLDVPDGLKQGRGAWGGLATGAMVSATQQFDPRPEMAVRTMSAQLVAPVLVGRAHLVAESLRRGSATHTIGVRVHDDASRLLAHGVVVLGTARAGRDMPDGPPWQSAPPPEELDAGPGAVPVVAIGPPLAPEFTTHLEFRPVTGLPFSGSADLEASGWIRPRGPVTAVDAAVVVALADAWWVAAMARLDRPRPAATVGFTVDLPGDPRWLVRDAEGQLEPLYHRGRVLAAREGFTVEARELWTASGTLMSWNTQTVATIK